MGAVARAHAEKIPGNSALALKKVPATIATTTPHASLSLPASLPLRRLNIAGMPSQKREAARREREGKSSDGMGNVKTKGENFYRSAKRVKQLSMYKDGKPQRNAAGRITKSASYQSNEKPIARVEPNRKWFTNSRVIGQDALAQFREAVAANTKDPHTFLMKQNKLPMSLIRDNEDNNVNGLKAHAAKIAVETSPYAHTFGPKVQRKRVKIGVGSMEDLADEAIKKHDTFMDRQEEAKLLSGTSGEQGGEQTEADDGVIAMALEPVLTKGQSKRIWNELYKVIDSSDVLLHILDARDPEGTRCRHVEQYLRNEAPHKHLVFLLNKCDLIPSSVVSLYLFFLFFLLCRGPIAKSRDPSPTCGGHICYSFGRLTSSNQSSSF